MNCSTCTHPINRNEGYYLVGETPYCSQCFQKTDLYCGIKYKGMPPAAGRKSNNLLEAFREYQQREQKSAFLRY